MFDVFYLDQPPELFTHERPAASVEHARELSRTRYLWVVSGLNDYSGFDWLWEPPPWQARQMHVWPSQHQANGGTLLVPRIVTTDVNREHAVIPRIKAAPIFGVSHGLQFDSGLQISRVSRYIDSYLGTLRRLLRNCEHEYVWVIADVCDYTDFDFTWHPSEWQDHMLHVFPSNDQKFGDTFYIHVPSFMSQTKTLALLEWYDTINFIQDIVVPRRPVPVVTHGFGSHVPAVWQHNFVTPVAQFTVDLALPNPPNINLWRSDVQAVMPLSPGASSVLVPRVVKNSLKTQLYDHPVIDRSGMHSGVDQPCDVVFISNGERMAEQHWQQLKKCCSRSLRSDGVLGREAAYKAAAGLAKTDWFYAVFAKTWVLDDFDFSFQPDRLQAAKHYIFHSRNALNGLEYGAMNINLYHRQLVLDTRPGLDFTLSALHTVIPICASISRFNSDPWITWRSAFRETMKLQREVDLGADPVIEHRLKVWCTFAEGENADYCIQGALDGVEYYHRVGGDLAALELSFDWAWCKQYYEGKYDRQLWSESV